MSSVKKEQIPLKNNKTLDIIVCVLLSVAILITITVIILDVLAGEKTNFSWIILLFVVWHVHSLNQIHV